MAYTPRVFSKHVWDSTTQDYVLRTRSAGSVAEDVALQYSGWTTDTPAPPPPAFTPRQLAAIEDLVIPGDSSVPLAGYEGQFLAKASDADLDLAWVDAPTPLPGGGTGIGGVSDTGWRKMPHEWPNAGNGNQLLNRTGNVVTLVVEGTHSGTFTLYIPEGFRSRSGFRIYDDSGLVTIKVGPTQVNFERAAADWTQAQISWTTFNAWPAELPGTEFND